MGKITVTFPVADGGDFVEEIAKLQRKKGLTPAQVGKAVAKILGTEAKTEAALYGFFRRGLRRISESRISPLAKVFQVNESEIHRINGLFHGDLNSMSLKFDPQIDLSSYLTKIPQQSKTLGKFLIWLSAESGREELENRLLPKE